MQRMASKYDQDIKIKLDFTDSNIKMLRVVSEVPSKHSKTSHKMMKEEEESPNRITLKEYLDKF